MLRISRFVWSLLAVALAPAAVVAQCNQNCPVMRTISVTSTATMTADADLAIVHVGYKLYGPDAKSAYASASETSNAIVRALTASGNLKKNIDSSSQVLQHTPPYELQQMQMDSEQRHNREFTVAQGWTVRVKPGAAGDALNTAINAGANESGWIEWVVENPTALQAQASSQALANAHKIAEQMVLNSDVHLGHLVSVSENQSQGMIGASAGVIGGILNGIAGANGTPPLAINSRRVEYNVTLYAVFSID